MQRVIALILIVVCILTSFTIPAYGANRDEYVELYVNNELTLVHEEVFDMDFYINNPNKSSSKSRLRINEKILQSDGYAVYGDYNDVPDNDKKEGEWRYVGYSYEGYKFSNFHFPWEARVEGRKDKDRKWIKDPWQVIGNSGSLLEEEKSNYNVEEKNTVAEWLEEVMNSDDSGWQDPGEHGEWTGERLVDYFNVQSPRTEYTAGSFIGWHYDSGI